MSNARFSAQSYPLAPTFDGTSQGQQGKKRSSSGVIKTEGRGATLTPQGLIVVQSTVLKEEKLRRRRITAKDGFNPKAQYGPAVKGDDDAVMSTHKGVLGMCVTTNQHTFRGGLGNDNNVLSVFAVNGLSRSEKLAIPCIAQVSRDANEKYGEDRTTLVVHGAQTIVNTGCQPIDAGMHLYVDPNPFTTTNDDGQVVSAVNVKGIPQETLFFQIRPIVTDTIYAWMRSIEDRMRLSLAKTMSGDIQKAIKAGDGVALFDAVRAHVVRTWTDELLYARDMPMLDLILIFVLDDFAQLALIPKSGLTGLDTPEVQQMANILGLQALVLALRAQVEAGSIVNREFQSALPQHTRPQPAYQSPQDTVHDDKLLTNLSPGVLFPAGGDKTTAFRILTETRARLALFVRTATCIGMQAQEEYFRRVRCGMALSSAAKGGQLDLYM